MKYIYKAVPFLGRVSELDPNKVASQLTGVINSQNIDGWDFYQINSVNIAVSPGCLEGLFGAKSFEKKFDMAIFRKELDGVEMANLENKEKERPPKWLPNCPRCGMNLNKDVTGCSGCGFLFSELIQSEEIKNVPASANQEMIFAVKNKDSNLVSQLLRNGNSANGADENGATLISIAISNNDTAMIQLLRAFGAKD